MRRPEQLNPVAIPKLVEVGSATVVPSRLQSDAGCLGSIGESVQYWGLNNQKGLLPMLYCIYHAEPQGISLVNVQASILALTLAIRV